jgi:isoamylase
MGERDWFTNYVRSFGMLLNGQVMLEWSERGDFVFDDPLLVLFNAYWEPLRFALPELGGRRSWRLIVDTARPSLAEQPHPAAEYPVEARSLVVLIQPRDEPSPGAN